MERSAAALPVQLDWRVHLLTNSSAACPVKACFGGDALPAMWYDSFVGDADLKLVVVA